MGQRGFVKDSSAPLVTKRPWNKGHFFRREITQISFKVGKEGNICTSKLQFFFSINTLEIP